MWRKKHGFDEFVEIVKQWPYLFKGETKIIWDYNKPQHKRRSEVKINIKYLNKCLKDFDKYIKQTYKNSDVLESAGGEEALKIQLLKDWCKRMNWNATQEIRELKKQLDYFKRLEDYENS